tara:strand:- start:234 stop:473 length:240 start_codon:yes stop_codon:yes gene_type:complete
MADTFVGSKDNEQMRDCPTCNRRVLNILDSEMECPDCKIDKQYVDLNVETNKPKVNSSYLANATIARGGKTKKLRKKQY